LIADPILFIWDGHRSSIRWQWQALAVNTESEF
jgi:hypothetical protein